MPTPSGDFEKTIPPSVARRLADRARRSDRAIVVGNRAGVVEWANRSWTRITGWPLEDTIAKPVVAFLDQAEIDVDLVDFVRTHFLEGRPCRVELPYRRPDGHSRWIHLEVEPVRDDLGEVGNFVAVATDITQRRLAEDERRAEEARLSATRAATSARNEDASCPADAAEPTPARVPTLEAMRLATRPLARAIAGLSEPGRDTQAPVDRRRLADLAARLDALAEGFGAPVEKIALNRIVAEQIEASRRRLSSRTTVDVCLERGLPETASTAALLRELVAGLLEAARLSVEDEWATISILTGVHDSQRAFISRVHPGPRPAEPSLRTRGGRCLYIEVHDTGAELAPGSMARLRAASESGRDRRPESELLVDDATAERILWLEAAGALCRALGGHLHVDSLPGCGTQALALLPLDA